MALMLGMIPYSVLFMKHVFVICNHLVTANSIWKVLGLIMADAALVFKNEIYYGDELLISIQATEFSRVGFDLIYKIEKKPDGSAIDHGSHL